MTEYEYLICDCYPAILDFVMTLPDQAHRANGRLVALFALACLREHWPNLPEPVRRGVEILEKWADFKCGQPDVDKAMYNVFRYDFGHIDGLVGRDVYTFFDVAYQPRHLPLGVGIGVDHDVPSEIVCEIFRDVFGNLFCDVSLPWSLPGSSQFVHWRSGEPVSLDPRCVCPWRTPDVLALAGGAYDSNDFSALPVLADALEEAGCDRHILLRHLRGEQEEHRCYRCGGSGTVRVSSFDYSGWHPCPDCKESGYRWMPRKHDHVRGCWALELLLTEPPRQGDA